MFLFSEEDDNVQWRTKTIDRDVFYAKLSLHFRGELTHLPLAYRYEKHLRNKETNKLPYLTPSRNQN